MGMEQSQSQRMYRLLRVLEYVGTREQIDSTLENRKIKGTFNVRGLSIYEACLGNAPQEVSFRWMREELRKRMAAAAPLHFNNDEMQKGYYKCLKDLFEELPL